MTDKTPTLIVSEMSGTSVSETSKDPSASWPSFTDDHGSTPVLIPKPEPDYVFQGRSVSPTSSDWSNKLIQTVIYGDFEIKYDASAYIDWINRYNSLELVNQTLKLQYDPNDCQLRKIIGWENNRNEIIHRGHASGQLTLKVSPDDLPPPVNTLAETIYYNLFCRLIKPKSLPAVFDPDPYSLVTQPSTGTGSLEMIANQCEIPFDEIVRSLEDFKVTNITEDEFRLWAKPDPHDFCDFQYDSRICLRPLLDLETNSKKQPIFRSGNEQDIKQAIILRQCQIQIPDFVSFNSSNLGKRYLDRIKIITDAKQPAPLSFLILPSLSIQSGHMVIVLDIKRNNGKYELEILDPNGPKITTMACSPKILSYRDSGILTNITLTVCYNNNTDGNYWLPFEVVNIETLRSEFLDFCNKNSQTNLCRTRKTNMTGWLKNNYPEIGNFNSDQFPIGTCVGWVEAVLLVTYLGNFIGECPRL